MGMLCYNLSAGTSWLIRHKPMSVVCVFSDESGIRKVSVFPKGMPVPFFVPGTPLEGRSRIGRRAYRDERLI